MNNQLFSGDTLLINGTGRTDFQNGSSKDAYNSIFNRLLKLPEDTLLYPGHDYNGKTVSTLGNEKKFNPRLQVKNADEYAAPARAIDLSGLPPTFIDVGELDLFRDEDIEFAKRLLQAGVTTVLHVYPGAYHASESFAPEAELSKQIWTKRIEALKRALNTNNNGL